jgi:hypothetical protein
MIKNVLITLFSLITIAAVAQPKLNSPYTRYGLGDLTSRALAVQTGRGGLTTAFNDPFHLNLANPASFAYLRTTTLETGLFAKYSHYTSSASSLDVWSGNLSYFALGFTLRSPVNEALDRKKSLWHHGMGVSLSPYSNVGYLVETRDTLPDLGDIRTSYEGSGGTYKLAWNGASRYKSTSFGATVGWLFGRSKYENTTYFVDSLPTFQDNFRDEYAVGGLIWNVGMQHDWVLQRAENDKDIPTKWITFGATAEGKHNVNTKADILRVRSRGKNATNGGFVDADTLSLLSSVDQSITLPSTLSFGVEYVKVDKFKAGAQFGVENWSQYKNEVRPETLRNTISLAGGIEFIPDYASYNKYLRRVRYRLGAYYRQDPRSVNTVNLDDTGISMGMGFPLVLPRQQTSFINFALEAGRFGKSSAIEESYVRMTVGFTFNDNSWFYKRRFE